MKRIHQLSSFFSAIIVGSILFSGSAAPLLNSWWRNTTGATGYNGYTADVQQVRYSDRYVYVNSSGIPSYSIGPWGNPGAPVQQSFSFKFPRTAVPGGGPLVDLPNGGPIALWVTGVPLWHNTAAQTYNNLGIWSQNANVSEAFTFDSCLGHPSPNQVYHTHQSPKCLWSGTPATQHSPLIGWAFDGFPIYGPYGYANVDGSGGITRMTSSYRQRSISQRTSLPDGTALDPSEYGPDVSATYPLGYYIEDHEYVEGLGLLDEHNGRFTITPEFPAGVYAYFVTVDASGNGVYPYVIGETFYGFPESDNFGDHSVSITETVTLYTGEATPTGTLPTATPTRTSTFGPSPTRTRTATTGGPPTPTCPTTPCGPPPTPTCPTTPCGPTRTRTATLGGPTPSLTRTSTATATETPLPTETATSTPTETEPPAATATRTPTATATSAPASGGVSASGRIVFTSGRDGRDQIYVMDADGANQTRLTTAIGGDSSPAWSPDGSRIAFVSHREGDGEIYVMDADGANQTRLTTSAGADLQPAWSPDGTRIAFVSDREGDGEIYVMDADGANVTRLTSTFLSNLHPAWSPDGTRIAFTSSRDGRDQIYVMDADGANQTRLSSTQAEEQYPAWSPDGEQIAFTSTREGDVEIYVMDADGANQVQLTANTTYDSYPAWSPDGTRLAFISERDGDDEQTDIYVMDADGANVTRLTTTLNNDEPDWSAGTDGIPYGGNAWPIPGTIQAEDYNVGGLGVAYYDSDGAENGNAYRSGDWVDTEENFDDGSNGYHVSSTNAGDWLKYTVDVAQAGSYTFSARVAQIADGAVFHVELDGVNVTGPVTLDSTGGWSSFDTISVENISLSAGTHLVELVLDTNAPNGFAGNYDWFAFAVPTPTPTATATAQPATLPGRIVYSTQRHMAQDSNYELYLMDTAGGNQTRLTTSAAFDNEAAWSPDGRQVAFTSNADGDNELYVMDADGANQVQLTANTSYDSYPAWSPDGTRIAFSTNRDGDFELYVMDADGANQTRLTNADTFDGFPAWSPTGQQIVFGSYRSGDLELYVMDADGGNVTRLTTADGFDGFPAWSPDGTWIAFSSIRSGNQQLYLMDADGANQTRLTNANADDTHPAWSPDGDYIVYASQPKTAGGTHDIYLIGADGSGLTRLTTDGGNYDPAWSAQGGDGEPYGGNAWPIPGRVEAENYNTGGQGVGFFDLNNGGANGIQRSDWVGIYDSIAEDDNVVYYVGSGEWLKYTVDVAQSGSYSLNLRAANVDEGGAVYLEVDGVAVTGLLSVPNTGGWESYETVSFDGIALSAGQHVLRLVFARASANGFVGNFNWLSLNEGPEGTPGATVTPTGTATPTSSNTPTAEPTSTETAEPTSTETAEPTSTATSEPTATNTPTPTSTTDPVDGNAYGVSAWPVPGTIQFEDYNTGGQGVAYSDTNAWNEGNAYRSEGPDVYYDNSEGHYALAYVMSGEWAKYTVSVAAPGLYSLNVRAANPGTGGSVRAEVDGVDITGSLIVPDTDSWSVYETISVDNIQLSAGLHVIRFVFERPSTGGGVGNFNWFSFTASPEGTPGVSNTPTHTATVEPTSTSTSTATVEPTSTSTATVEPTSTSTATVEPTSTSTSTATVEPTSTSTATATAAPTNTPTATSTADPLNGNAYGVSAWPIPGIIQAENFNTGGQGVGYYDTTAANEGGSYRPGESVDIASTLEGNGGYQVGWFLKGEWLNYTVRVAEAGSYAINARVANAGALGAFHVEVDGVDVTGSRSIPNTNGHYTFAIISAGEVQLSAGLHVVRLVSEFPGNFDWLSFTAAPEGTPVSTTTATATASPTRSTTPTFAPTHTATSTTAPAATSTMTAAPTSTSTATAQPSSTSTTQPTATHTALPTSTATATATAKPNLVLNPGMERDANLDNKPDRWSASPYVTRSKASRHSGTYSMRHFATNNASYLTQQTIASVKGGQPYTFSAWTNIPATRDTFSYKLQLQWLNRSGAVISTSTVKTYTAATGGWQQATAQLTPPLRAVKARVVMRVSGLAATIYADDFELR